MYDAFEARGTVVIAVAQDDRDLASHGKFYEHFEPRPRFEPGRHKDGPGAAVAGPGQLYRDGRIRTGDPCNPIAVRYRAAPRPEDEETKGFGGGREAVGDPMSRFCRISCMAWRGPGTPARRWRGGPIDERLFKRVEGVRREQRAISGTAMTARIERRRGPELRLRALSRLEVRRARARANTMRVTRV